MPIHDWSKVDAGLFHAFHQMWTIEISNALNQGVLPSGFFALPEQIVGGPIPDVITLQRGGKPVDPKRNGGLAVAEAPPKARYLFSTESEGETYAARANRITVKHRLGEVVAVIEIVSPGNKSSTRAIRSFVEKAYDLIRQGINLLVVDLFPPSRRDLQGVHKLIWDEFQDEAFELPVDKRLTVVAYSAGELKRAYVEPVAVGDPLPSHPIFLDPATYVPAPLESTYQTTWAKCPDALKEAVEKPVA